MFPTQIYLWMHCYIIVSGFCNILKLLLGNPELS